MHETIYCACFIHILHHIAHLISNFSSNYFCHKHNIHLSFQKYISYHFFISSDGLRCQLLYLYFCFLFLLLCKYIMELIARVHKTFKYIHIHLNIYYTIDSGLKLHLCHTQSIFHFLWNVPLWRSCTFLVEFSRFYINECVSNSIAHLLRFCSKW